ncbi:serine/threonine protein kinase [Pendulispora albinea]|uniref:Serine/threonine protein kinase n=1 Tax=Pendulispora albinea TaxID=2741071 RepID=A0ABZ2M8M7_9BACT
MRIGKYELGERIAVGGMAEVYLARLPLGGNRMVALKVLRDELADDPTYVTMFIDEAKLLAKLAHPSTVQIYESGEDRGRYFLAMELLIGDSFQRVWEACQDHGYRIPYGVSAWIAARVAEGLHHAHELRDEKGKPENVVHRDVNPSNIQMTFDGRIKIIDFGLARSESRASKTAAGIVKGKLAYLSPEQIDGEPPDRRADIFALGTTLWEVTVDRRLFKRENDLDTVRAIQRCVVPDPRTLVPDYPASLWTIARRALARDPRERYQTALDMAKALDACAPTLGPEVSSATLSKLMGQVCTWAK